jgi:hypothetical protein
MDLLVEKLIPKVLMPDAWQIRFDADDYFLNIIERTERPYLYRTLDDLLGMLKTVLDKCYISNHIYDNEGLCTVKHGFSTNIRLIKHSSIIYGGVISGTKAIIDHITDTLNNNNYYYFMIEYVDPKTKKYVTRKVEIRIWCISYEKN